MGVVLELPAPGMQDIDTTREVRTDKTRIFDEPFEGERRGFEHGVVSDALMGAYERSERLRHGEGEEEVRPRELLVQVVLEPLVGLMLLALGTVPVATGMIDAVLPPTAWALRETMSVVAALALLDGTDDLAMRNGEVRVALQVLGRKGGEDIAKGGHDRRPCMRALRRS